MHACVAHGFSLWMDLQLSASFLTALACRPCVLPAACVTVRGRILEAHPLAGTTMCKGCVHAHATSGKQKQDVIREKLPSRGVKSYTHTQDPQGAVLRQGPAARVLVEREGSCLHLQTALYVSRLWSQEAAILLLTYKVLGQQGDQPSWFACLDVSTQSPASHGSP